MCESPRGVVGLCSLADLVLQRPDQELAREQLVQHVDGRTVILQAGLERTGIIRPLPDDGTRELVRLDLLRADPEQLRWQDRHGWNGATQAQVVRGRATARASARQQNSRRARPKTTRIDS